MSQLTMDVMKQPKTSADDKFELTDPDNLFQAVFRVLHRYQTEGREPGAEHWQADTRWKRPALIADIREAWLDVMGEDCLMPWHDDYLIYCWVALRKCPNENKRALCEWFGLDCPKKWAASEA